MRKAEMSEDAFEMEYQLNPLPEKGRLFNWDDVKFFRLEDMKPEDLKQMRIIAAMDMAFGKSERAHFTALTVCGYLRGEYF